MTEHFWFLVSSPDYLRAWGIAFCCTQIMEIPVYVAFIRDRPWYARLGIAFLATLITHPFVWFVFPVLFREDYTVQIAVSEGFAWLAEAAWLAATGTPPLRAILLALAANATSWGIGTILQDYGVL